VGNTSSLERKKNQISNSEYVSLRRRSVAKNSSSSSNDELDEDTEAEVNRLLCHSRSRLVTTESLKEKQRLLKADDYVRYLVFFICGIYLNFACVHCSFIFYVIMFYYIYCDYFINT
jgi:hypothetical protein